MASQATGLLKSDAHQASKEEVVTIDRGVLQRIFGVVTASMIAVSAYAYMV